MRSLRNRLTFMFFAITLLAIAALYVYLAPGLGSRLLGEKLNALVQVARRESPSIARTVGSSESQRVVRSRVIGAAVHSGDRVTLLLVNHVDGRPQLSPVASSTSTPPPFPLAYRAIRAGKLEARTAEIFAEVADPVSHRRAVIVYSTPISDVVSNVAVVRREILVAGGIALLLALLGGYLVAGRLAQRVKRLEQAAERVAAGEFAHPIPVDSRDELGQLAKAFNDMQRQLAQLQSARENFIATASHELRTPIFSLGGFVELLEDEDLDPETRRRFLDQVREQVDRLSKLSVDLLDLSKLEAGSLELREEQVDLGELTRSVSGEFEPALAQHDSHLELRVARTLDAHCDPVRVAQIMRILIDNALTHTASGTRIVVTARRSNGRVMLAVRDNGEGIQAAAARRIFEPFFTADDAQGSGLGLAIASELAGRMAGRLSMASEPGNTVFTLELPA
ncbi:MAG: HAMP domain-containing histidine kinase [Solirubrobacterales bacterium]|nr:HAMP domain-containing histidine kinase [Solirubrobacterales bacterium]MBV9167748.1 HAMP domain-containing histidine kinase [Solirubrobacterales bacterium]MBV9533862.1 HAMP domain-containing histidine kinase [Solirubrobacterales bacterium]